MDFNLILAFIIELRKANALFFTSTFFVFLPVLLQFHNLFSLEQAGDEALDNQWQF